MCQTPAQSNSTRVKQLQWMEDKDLMDWRRVLWTGEVPLTVGKDNRRHWIWRRKMESLKPGFTLPTTPQGKQLML